MNRRWSRNRSTRRGIVLPILATLAVVVSLVGCSSLPDHGPIHEVTGAAPSSTTSSGPYYDPARPAQDASPEEVMDGFLEAMKAIPVRTSAAREYLTREARRTWSPEREIITYDTVITRVEGTTVVISVSGGGRYDATGAWQGHLTAAQRELTATLRRENGEWRVDRAPDALLVPSGWFAEQYQRAARYLFDPTGRVLTPEPIFVARGDQLSTLLVNGLTSPVPEKLADVVRTDIPVDLRAGLSVPVDSAGVAQIDLTGKVRGISAEQQDRAAAQFVWTMRQDPRVRALRITLAGQELGTGDTLPLSGGAAFDPTGANPDGAVYAVRDGALVRGTLDDLSALSDVSSALAGASALAVTPDGERLAVVDRRRHRVLVGDTGATELAPVLVGSRVLDPAWDLAGRMWVADGGERARLRVRDAEGVVTEVTAPGITGQHVRQILVSRDGTRLVALVRGPRADRVVVSRVRQTTGGAVQGLNPAEELWYSSTPPERYLDISWQGPAAVAALSSYTEDTSQVQVAGVDGAPVAVDDAVLVRGGPRHLLGTPSDASRVLVVTDAGVMDSSSQTTVTRVDEDLRWLTFTG